jgi:hypothetical protein
VKKLISGSSAAVYVGLLEKSKTSNDALQVLLRISDSLKFQVCTSVRYMAMNYKSSYNIRFTEVPGTCRILEILSCCETIK